MTTVSVINPEVTYRESKTIDDEDIGYKSQVYELDLDYTEELPGVVAEIQKPTPGKSIAVVIGKPKYIYTDKNIVFFPIYAVQRSKVRSQIGVFEVKSSQLLNIYKNGELDVNSLSKPLYYSFSKPEYLAKLDVDPLYFKDRPLTHIAVSTSAEQEQEEDIADADESILEKEREEDRHLALRLDKTKQSKMHTNAKNTMERGVLEDIDGFNAKEPLTEETKEMADQERSEYKESARNMWIEKYMRNNNYRIHEVESNGDCLFAVIRDAFADIGKRTSVDKLRAILAAEMSDDIFHEYRTVYLSFLDETQSLKRDLAEVEKTLKEYQKRVKQITDSTTADGKELLKKSKELEQEKKNIKQKIAETEENISLYTGNIKQIDTLEKMRQHILTSSYWADSWAISTLERVLNVKLILFSEQAFQSEDGLPDLDGVLLCSDVSKELQERQTFSPDYYIMTTYSGDHYRLISYKSRKIFQFKEIPYDTKILILNRCLSRLSGVYYMIQDFRNFKTKFGIDEDEGAPTDYAEMEGYGELFKGSTVFVFCAKSDSKVKPGEGSGEKISSSDKSKYAKLNSKYIAWRKKLDDDWDKSPIIVDGHKWTSITHYMQGVQYKKTHPDVYLMFSLDSDADSNLAKSVKEAKSFKGIVKEVEPEKGIREEGKKVAKAAKKKIQVIAPDLDFDEKAREEERKKALSAKFNENDTMRLLLKATGDALLIHKCGSGEPAEVDFELMRIRHSI
jgi:predicted NAD-dependent protein-ADP-ribosyltransferase YbiA (DUF1768 family)/uncharacterized protein YoxC